MALPLRVRLQAGHLINKRVLFWLFWGGISFPVLRGGLGRRSVSLRVHCVFVLESFIDCLTRLAVNLISKSPCYYSPRQFYQAEALRGSDHWRVIPVILRLEQQRKVLNLPILPTTTTGFFPQKEELCGTRCEYKSNRISEADNIESIKQEIAKVVKMQEDLGIDVLVHGEPERNNMVEYFGEKLKGVAFTVNGWVQSYGSTCVKPPIIFGDVSRPKEMTVFGSKYAQSLTPCPMKGMLTGPVTILNRSFVRDDQPRSETCIQIALAIKEEVEELEANGIQVIQIDEPALWEGLPLRNAEQADYLKWAIHCFCITNYGVKDITQPSRAGCIVEDYSIVVVMDCFTYR